MDRYTKAWSATNRMIRQGRSFSGREANACFLNLQTGRFADISAASGLDLPEDGRAIATADWDHDGDLDVWMTFRTGPRLRYFENRYANKGRSLQMQLEGNSCNRDAIGTRVEVWLEGQSAPRIRTVRAGHGYLGQSSSQVHVGIAAGERVAKIVVRWPGSQPQVIALKGNPNSHRIRLVQGEAPVSMPQRAQSVAAKPASVHVPSSSEESRTALIAKLPSPPDWPLAGLREFAKSSTNSAKAVPTYVVFWATWCQPCLRELADLAQHEAQIRGAGLRVVALNVDSATTSELSETVEDDPDSDPNRILKSLKFPYESTQATPQFVQSMDVIQRTILDRERPLPVPSSFLLDRNGQLAAFYKGAVEWQQIQADVQSLDVPPSQRRATAIPFSGKWLSAPSATDPMRIAIALYDAGLVDQAIAYTANVENYVTQGDGATYMQEQLKRKQQAQALSLRGVILLELDKPQQAISPLLNAVELQPKDLRTRMKLGEAYAKTGKPEMAVPHLEKASELAPSDPDIHYDLAISLTAAARVVDAIPHYRQTLHLKPYWPPAANNLAWILSTHPDPSIRDGKGAVQLAKEVCRRVNYRDPTALDTLAVAYAEIGNFREALKNNERARRLALSQKNARLLESLKKRQKLFEKRQAYRDKL